MLNKDCPMPSNVDWVENLNNLVKQDRLRCLFLMLEDLLRILAGGRIIMLHKKMLLLILALFVSGACAAGDLQGDYSFKDTEQGIRKNRDKSNKKIDIDGMIEMEWSRSMGTPVKEKMDDHNGRYSYSSEFYKFHKMITDLKEVNDAAKAEADLRNEHGYDLIYSYRKIADIAGKKSNIDRFLQFAPRNYYYASQSGNQEDKAIARRDYFRTFQNEIKMRFVVMAEYYKNIAENIAELELNEGVNEADIRRHLNYLALYLYGARELRPSPEPFDFQSVRLNIIRQIYADGIVFDFKQGLVRDGEQNEVI